jgi:hypothetical protein
MAVGSRGTDALAEEVFPRIMHIANDAGATK